MGWVMLESRLVWPPVTNSINPITTIGTVRLSTITNNAIRTEVDYISGRYRVKNYGYRSGCDAATLLHIPCISVGILFAWADDIYFIIVAIILYRRLRNMNFLFLQWLYIYCYMIAYRFYIIILFSKSVVLLYFDAK